MEGFSYNGLHSSLFSVYYIPDESALFDDQADFEVFDEEPNWRDGGVYYGNRVKQREFSLSCYFEDVTREQKEKINQWLDRNTSGELVFDERPFVAYKVRPTKKLNGKIYTQRYDDIPGDRFSGTFTLTFTAYDPFGYMKYNSYDVYDTDGAARYCGIVSKSAMPAAPDPNKNNFLVYNCGTERCGCLIRIAGTAPNGLTLTNNANMNRCKLIALPPTPGYLEIDSVNGVVRFKTTTGSEDEIVFEYHDEGYITLESCGFVYDEAVATYSKTSKIVSFQDRELDNSYIGKYIRIAGAWHKIMTVNKTSATLDKEPATSGVDTVSFVTMNQITITGENVNLTRLEIEYTPKVQ